MIIEYFTIGAAWAVVQYVRYKKMEKDGFPENLKAPLKELEDRGVEKENVLPLALGVAAVLSVTLWPFGVISYIYTNIKEKK